MEGGSSSSEHEVRAETSRKRAREDDQDFLEEQPSKKLVDPQHSQFVAMHYNAREETGVDERKNSRIFYMRNFNNWIKSQLINEYLEKIRGSITHGSPLRVLDMCCGKGGDLLKWLKGNITYLYCTDIAEVSVEQCRVRYQKIPSNQHDRKPFAAEFFTADSTRDRIRERYKDPSMKLNLVSCQFAFHYSFETIKQAQCMLKNASECLNVGGYFIGTIPDANQIISRLKAADSHTFGNDIYSIKFMDDVNISDLPIFGAKYNFVLDGVVDCPEFLVYFPALVKLAKKYSLELVAKERFEDYYETKIRSGRDLLEKMKALEPYSGSASDNKDLSHDEADYDHAKEYFYRRGSGNTGGYNRRKVGTLSKSEWEAISLYMMFAFVKVKTPDV